jgi:chromate transport protein ChrA
MDQDLYNIAKHNLKIRKKATWVAVIGMIIYCALLFYLMYFEKTWPLFIIVPGVVFLFWYVFYQERKIIGKKGPMEREMEKLKDAGITTDDLEPLELKQIINQYRDDELV